MQRFNLVESTTKDGLIHQGIYFKPEKLGKKALLWIHGLTGRFYGDVRLMNEFATACEKEGYGFAAFNNRGHDHITSTHKTDKTYAFIGGGREVFKECIFDIHAGVDFLVNQGYSDIFVIGHSTGALKLIYSEGTKPHMNVAGVILSGALSDRLGSDIDKQQLEVIIKRMEAMIHANKGDELVSGLSYFPMTPKRFLSLYKQGFSEDVVDYGDVQPKMTAFSHITKPMLVIFAENDENLDRPVKEVQNVFKSKTQARKYKSIVILDADHGYTSKEKEVVDHIISWVSEL